MPHRGYTNTTVLSGKTWIGAVRETTVTLVATPASSYVLVNPLTYTLYNDVRIYRVYDVGTQEPLVWGATGEEVIIKSVDTGTGEVVFGTATLATVTLDQEVDIIYIIDTNLNLITQSQLAELYNIDEMLIDPNWLDDGTTITPRNGRLVDGTIVPLESDRTVTKEPTGFVDGCIVTGDSTARTVTLSGTVAAYFLGNLCSWAIDTWESPAHGSDTAKVYYLYSTDGTEATWSETVWDFSYLQISYAFYNSTLSSWVYQRECHGFMPWSTHEECHNTIGSWRQNGGDVGGYTLDSTTAAERRPTVSEMVHHDEDLETTQAALAAGTYTQGYLTSTGVATFLTTGTDIVSLSTANPYYNSFSSPNWGQTLMPANSVMSIWLLSAPMAADATSQKFRFVWIQGQWITQGTGSGAPQMLIALNKELARNFSEVNLGNYSDIEPELLPIGRVVISYVGGDWYLSSVESLSGSFRQLSSTASGNFLSTVATDTTLTGTGTVADPLTVVQDYVTLTGDQTIAGVKTFVSFPKIQKVEIDDWFLPSLDEISLMRTNLADEGVGDFATGNYWSSSEYSSSSSYYLGFPTGSAIGAYKGAAYNVRAIRAFTSTTVYSLRDTGPSGGLIFRVSGSDYLEAAPADESTPLVWSDVIAEIGTTGTAVGTGQANTATMLAQSATAPSAKACDDKTVIGTSMQTPTADSELITKKYAVDTAITYALIFG